MQNTTYFNSNYAATENSGVFGFPYTENDSYLILLPIPWDATSSYKAGTANGPRAIFDASKFIELYDKHLSKFYEVGIFMADSNANIKKWNKKARKLALPVIKNGGAGSSSYYNALTKRADNYCQKMNEYVYNKMKQYLEIGKMVGLVGGDHSVSLGSIKAHAEKYPKMGVLQIDAHCDLRESFEGFTYSHGSVMNNVLKETRLERLVQVGVRGYCEEEFNKIRSSPDRIHTFFDDDISQFKANGETWDNICNQITNSLPTQVYISLDIDGLDPSLCKHTGTPVPGGLSYQEIVILIGSLVNVGKKIVGFDLVEVNVDKHGGWDENVGAHILYKLAGFSIFSNVKVKNDCG